MSLKPTRRYSSATQAPLLWRLKTSVPATKYPSRLRARPCAASRRGPRGSSGSRGCCGGCRRPGPGGSACQIPHVFGKGQQTARDTRGGQCRRGWWWNRCAAASWGARAAAGGNVLVFAIREGGGLLNANDVVFQAEVGVHVVFVLEMTGDDARAIGEGQGAAVGGELMG